MSAARPAASAVRPYHFPAVHRLTMANGLRLVVARMPRLPIVTALALVDVGAAGDPRGAEGLAALMARTLDEGTGELDGAALTDRFESLGTSFEAAADWDSVVARLTVSPSRLETAFALFAQVLRAPSFPVADVARTRDERLDDLAQLLAEPRGLADMRFSGFLYGRGARYGRPSGGAASSVAAFDAAAVRAFHARHVGPGTTTLIFVGDVTPDEAERVVRRHFEDWKASVVRGSAAPERVAPETRRVVVVDKPDAPQSELRVGHIGVPRAHPDHLAIVVMNAILGGLFSSRINLNLRERNAFTYGASSGFDWRRGRGPFVVNTAVRSDVTARAVAEILAEIETMRAAPPAPAEVSLATEYLAGVFPIRYETTAAVAGALAGAEVYGLGEDWFRTYRDRVRAISPAEVLAAAQAHLDPSRLLVLAVGDARVIESPLAELAIAPVTVHAATFDPTE